MSSDLVEGLHHRIRLELKRLGISLAEASRRIGEENNMQNLKDVVSGRKRCQAELVGKLTSVGVDPVFVLTGVRSKDVTEWITFVGGNNDKLPGWIRTAGYDPDATTIYAPAAIAGVSEAEVSLATKFDGMSSRTHMDHLFVPADWLMEEFPKCRSVCEALVKSVEAYIEEMEVDAALFEQQEDQGEERAGISSEERALLENYRSLSEEDRRAIRRQSDVFAEFNRMKQQQQDKKAG